MSVRTHNLLDSFTRIDQALVIAKKKRDFDCGLLVAKEVIGLLGVEDVSVDLKSFPRLKTNPSWTKNAPDYEDRKASYVLAENNPHNIDFKLFWVNKPAKRIIANLVALTPNFEDEPFYANKNVGIDFVLSENADRLIIVLSNSYKIRVLELHERLSNTQKKIFEKWRQEFDFGNKAQVHRILWDSFDIQPLNKEFYIEISGLFNDLVQHLEKKNILDKKHRSQFVNRLIGRIIFCWFLRKKEIVSEDVGYFDAQGRSATEYYQDKLETLFFKVLNTPIEERPIGVDDRTPFLNGGLFEPKESDLFGKEELSFPEDYFERFYKFLGHYNFTTDESTSDFQQVAIDPEMLGRIFENLLAEETEETGEQARKAKGAFYTPREIVDYMCRESLRAYVSEKLGNDAKKEEVLQLLFDKKEHEFDLKGGWGNLGSYKNRVIEALDQIKIIDPACGSGAFPIGMLQIMLSIYERLDTRLDHYKTKIGIIKNNIYGSDIEPMAVEISRLRTWLSLVVDSVIKPSEKNKGIEELPNLDFKFVCADSLIPLSDNGQIEAWDNNELKETMRAIRERYFKTNSQRIKDKMKRDFQEILKNNQSIFVSEKQKQLLTYHPFDSDNVCAFFDSSFMFGVSEFDIVIANPPYVFTRKMQFTDKFKEDIRLNYFSYLKTDGKEKGSRANQSGKINYFLLFIMQGLRLAKKNKFVSYIVPNTILRTTTYDLYRRYILDEAKILEIIDLGGGIFDGVTAATNILLLEKTNENKTHAIKAVSQIRNFETRDWTATLIPQSNFCSNVSYAFNIFVDENNSKIMKRIEEDKIHLGDICSDIIEGIVAHKHLIKEEGGNLLYPLMEGKSIKPYTIEKLRKYIIWDKKKIHRARPDYLWELDKKIVIQRISGGSRPVVAAIDTKKLRTFASVNNLVLKDEYSDYYEYVAALLNSSVLNYYYSHNFSNKSNLTVNISKTFLEKLPLPIPNKKSPIIHNIQSLVRERQDMKSSVEESSKLLLEKKIDDMVMDLYGLTIDERNIIKQASLRKGDKNV